MVGLTTATLLAEAGLTTRILASEPPERSTSVAAGAVWGPVRCGPPDKIREWARTGLEVFSELAGEPPGAGHPGVRQATGIDVSRQPASPPPWLDLLPDQRLLGPGELPGGYASGWRYTAPLVTMPRYLAYLAARYQRAGGSVTIGEVSSLAALDAPLIVNCAGIGARELVPDAELTAVRGQAVVVRNPGIEEFFIDHADNRDYVYIFPHDDVALLGGIGYEDDYGRAPDPAVTARIIAGCCAVHPELATAEVLAVRVGLRPCRPQVRLEAEPLGGGRTLWHNYGHGGGGVTLSWGCARELAQAVAG